LLAGSASTCNCTVRPPPTVAAGKGSGADFADSASRAVIDIAKAKLGKTTRVVHLRGASKFPCIHESLNEVQRGSAHGSTAAPR